MTMSLDLDRLPRTVSLLSERGVAPDDASYHLDLLDQTRLPYDEVYLHLSDWRAVVEAIKALRVRGAPAIGVAGAAAVVLAASEVEKERPGSDDDFAVQLGGGRRGHIARTPDGGQPVLGGRPRAR